MRKLRQLLLSTGDLATWDPDLGRWRIVCLDLTGEERRATVEEMEELRRWEKENPVDDNDQQ